MMFQTSLFWKPCRLPHQVKHQFPGLQLSFWVALPAPFPNPVLHRANRCVACRAEPLGPKVGSASRKLTLLSLSQWNPITYVLAVICLVGSVLSDHIPWCRISHMTLVAGSVARDYRKGGVGNRNIMSSVNTAKEPNPLTLLVNVTWIRRRNQNVMQKRLISSPFKSHLKTAEGSARPR